MRKELSIGRNVISNNHPVYFIADIAANHDGSLERAKELIELAKECGAHAAKFQHHNVSKYVSDAGFKSLGGKFSHQSKWKKTIFEVYKDAQVPTEWTHELKEHCQKINIDFFSTPYDLDMVDHLNPFVPAYKIGSGDVAWEAMLEKIALSGKPILFATGAATLNEVTRAVDVITKHNDQVVLMQCNTNYTGSLENFRFINLNVLKTYRTLYPEMILGLSDHTPGHATVLGAVTLGARVVEKHFTDDTKRDGPDHPFSMDPKSWKAMVENTVYLVEALGSTIKKVEDNEMETVILQRRSIRAIAEIKKGEPILREKLQFQRPCPADAIHPNDINKVLNKNANLDISSGDYLKLSSVQW